MISLGLAGASLADIKNQPGAILLVGKRGEKIVVAFVLRVDTEAARTVGVVVVAGSKFADMDLTGLFMPWIEKMFSENGCDQVRIHTGRPGMAKKLYRMGYETTELILTKEIKNG